MTSDAPRHSVLEPVSRDPLAPLRALVDDFAAASHAPQTVRAYASAWKRFDEWARANAFVPLPASAETAALYLAFLASLGRRTATIERALVAISRAHADSGHPSPRNHQLVRRVLRGIRRRLGCAPTPRTAIRAPDLERMLKSCGSDLRGLRDRAILGLGFATALRRSEIVALRLDDITFDGDDLLVLIRRAKSDQEARGRVVRVIRSNDEDACPVGAVRLWIERSLITEGALFRAVTSTGRTSPRAMNARGVARIVKRVAARAGLDPDRFAAHSLRRGYATEAARAGKDERAIAARLGHRTGAMARRYIDDAGVA